jgi:hypothetical protein
VTVVRLGYGVCVGWWEEFTSYVVPWVGDRAVYQDSGAPLRPLVALSGQTSIAAAYNAILDLYSARYELDGVVLLHSDLQITDPAFEDKVTAGLGWADDVALVGVAGGGAADGTAWWNDDPIGHQLLDDGPLDFGVRAGFVDVLEGSLLVFSAWAVDNLRFDTEMPGFHGYDTVCLQARAAGYRCFVADIDTHHHTVAGRWRSAQSAADWQAAHERSLTSWGSGEAEPGSW